MSGKVSKKEAWNPALVYVCKMIHRAKKISCVLIGAHVASDLIHDVRTSYTCFLSIVHTTYYLVYILLHIKYGVVPLDWIVLLGFTSRSVMEKLGLPAWDGASDWHEGLSFWLRGLGSLRTLVPSHPTEFRIAIFPDTTDSTFVCLFSFCWRKALIRLCKIIWNFRRLTFIILILNSYYTVISRKKLKSTKLHRTKIITFILLRTLSTLQNLKQLLLLNFFHSHFYPFSRLSEFKIDQ